MEEGTLFPVCKRKTDVQKYVSYRSIKLMSHTMKLWEKVIEHRSRGQTR